MKREKKIKTYEYTVNNGISRGTFYIQAINKKQAICQAMKLWTFSVNVSSFRVKK